MHHYHVFWLMVRRPWETPNPIKLISNRSCEDEIGDAYCVKNLTDMKHALRQLVAS